MVSFLALAGERIGAAGSPGAGNQQGAVLARIPGSLADIDNGKILGFGADLAEDHPVRCDGLQLPVTCLLLYYLIQYFGELPCCWQQHVPAAFRALATSNTNSDVCG